MQWHTRLLREVSWAELETRQRELVAHVREAADPCGFLLLSEPAPTYTCGRSGVASDLLWNEEELARHGISVAAVSRGGKWTYHGTGQILLYPIVSLQGLGYPRHAVRRFVCNLRLGVARYLESLGLRPEMGESPFGLYIDGNKIASFGIAVERGVSSHGVALYYRPQEAAFRGIHPCGTPGQRFTSLEELLHERLPEWRDAAAGLAESVKMVFNDDKN